jgi:RNA polymerase sigma-70 factor (sigma-E family)
LLRSAYLLTGDQQLAEDLVQSALEKTAARWGSIRATGAAEAYVRRAMYRQQVSWWRRRRVAESLTDTVPDAASTASSNDVVDNRLLMREALLSLGRRQRTVLVLRYYEDLTEQEVAAILGISVGTVKSQTAKALHRLRTSRLELMSFARTSGEEALQ